ncbi:uncharacterized protein LOC126329970 [Schistocerca gregaria]|uniref:uncharacterized protein LOC126329970 n=1 Tax=Schistocerca gregaria TaxID=7010 RepID=UPI00211E8659|nr:uncharacterized protein LOC126329970 [Schistocerca gregaria]
MSRSTSDRVDSPPNSWSSGNLSVSGSTIKDLYPSIHGHDVTSLIQDLSANSGSQSVPSGADFPIYPSISSADEVDRVNPSPRSAETATLSEPMRGGSGGALGPSQQVPSGRRPLHLATEGPVRSSRLPLPKEQTNKYPSLSFSPDWRGEGDGCGRVDTGLRPDALNGADAIPRVGSGASQTTEPASGMMIPVYFGDGCDQGLSVIYPSHLHTGSANKVATEPSNAPSLLSSAEPSKEYTFVYPQLSFDATRRHNYRRGFGSFVSPHSQTEIKDDAPSDSNSKIFGDKTTDRRQTISTINLSGQQIWGDVYPYPPTSVGSSSATHSLESLTICDDTVIECHDNDLVWLSRVSIAQSFVSEAKQFSHLDYSIWNLRYTFPSVFDHKPCALLSSLGCRARPRQTDIDCDWLIVDPDVPPLSRRLHTQHAKKTHLVNFISFEKNSHLNHSSPKEYIQKILYRDEVDIPELQSICRQHGIPKRMRAFVWQLLLGYTPTKASERCRCLKSRRSEYLQLVERFFNLNPIKRSTRLMFGLVTVDTPRTHPDHFLNLFCTRPIQNTLERILYIWSCTNQHISYYQGLNDLASILLVVFLDCCLGDLSDERGSLPSLDDLQTALLCVEPDTYHCLTILLKNIGTFHTLSRGGVYSESMLAHMESLVRKLDPTLYKHIVNNELEFVHFAFRWMLCLFTRELTTKNLICLWDSCIVEGIRGFSEFYICVCTAYLLELGPHLLGKDMISMMGFIQHAPAIYFTKQDVHHLVRKAHDIFSQHPLNLKPRGSI